MATEPIDPETSRWTIQGPLGLRAQWIIKVTEERANELIRYETVTSPRLKTYWEIYFAPGSEAVTSACIVAVNQAMASL